MLRHLAIAAFLLATPFEAARADDLTALTDQAVAENPSIEAMRAKERALRARAEVAGAWSDPMLAIEYSNAPVSSFSLSSHPMSGLQLRAQQTLRPPSWSRQQREVGEARADAMAFSVEEAELSLRASIRRTWWMLARSRMLKDVTESHLARTEDLRAAAESRYTTGTVGQHAVLRLGVLRDQLKDELGDFQRSDDELTAALQQALAGEHPKGFETPKTVAPLAPLNDADWLAQAQEDRPLLQRIGAERASAEHAADFARTDALPDVTVWAGYRIRSVQTATDPGVDFVSVGVGVPLPTGSARKARGARVASLEQAQASTQALEASLDGIIADMASISARWHRAWEKANTYDEVLIPGAATTLEATQGDFAVGRAEFASLFEAEVALLNLERARIAAAIETHILHVAATAVLGSEPTVDTP